MCVCDDSRRMRKLSCYVVVVKMPRRREMRHWWTHNEQSWTRYTDATNNNLQPRPGHRTSMYTAQRHTNSKSQRSVAAAGVVDRCWVEVRANIVGFHWHKLLLHFHIGCQGNTHNWWNVIRCVACVTTVIGREAVKTNSTSDIILLVSTQFLSSLHQTPISACLQLLEVLEILWNFIDDPAKIYN